MLPKKIIFSLVLIIPLFLFAQPIKAQVQPIGCCPSDRNNNDPCSVGGEIGFCIQNASNNDSLGPINQTCTTNNFCFPYKEESQLPCCANGTGEWSSCSGPSPLTGFCISSEWNPYSSSCSSGLVCGYLHNPDEPEDCCESGSSQSQTCSLADGSSGYCSQLGGSQCTSGLLCRPTPDSNPNCCNPGSSRLSECSMEDGTLGQCQTASESDNCSTSGLICQAPDGPGSYQCICQSLGAGGYSCDALDQCSPGFEPDYSLCRDYPTGGDIPCGSVGSYCDMGACITPGSNELGDTCNTSAECVRGLTCENMFGEKVCTKPLGTVSIGGSCKYTQECQADPDPDNFETFCGYDSDGDGDLESCAIAGLPDGCTCFTRELSPYVEEYDNCRQAGPDLYHECNQCNGVWSAIGCIPSDKNLLTKIIIQWSMGIAGGFALLFILVGSFMTSISQGSPEKLQQAKQIISSAIFGLLFIILSVAILQFIGVQIFQIPGL